MSESGHFLSLCYISDELFRLVEPQQQLPFHSVADTLLLKYCAMFIPISCCSHWLIGHSGAFYIFNICNHRINVWLNVIVSAAITRSVTSPTGSWTCCSSALSHIYLLCFGLVVNPAESVDLNNAETCNHLLPWLARNMRAEAPGKDAEWGEAGISSLNEGLNGTLPSEDWNYCHMEPQIEFK